MLLLRPLSDDAIVALVRQEFGPGADPVFCAAFVEVTGGNPFLLAEALIALRAVGADPTGSAAIQVRTLSSDTIARSVLARLAPHLLVAEAASDPAMVEMLRAAADDAMASGSPEIAVQCLQRALVEPVDPESRGAVHTKLGRALGLANRFAESEDALRSGLDCTPDPPGAQ